jgi:hypothetical protein
VVTAAVVAIEGVAVATEGAAAGTAGAAAGVAAAAAAGVHGVYRAAAATSAEKRGFLLLNDSCRNRVLPSQACLARSGYARSANAALHQP